MSESLFGLPLVVQPALHPGLVLIVGLEPVPPEWDGMDAAERGSWLGRHARAVIVQDPAIAGGDVRYVQVPSPLSEPEEWAATRVRSWGLTVAEQPSPRARWITGS